MLTGILVIAMEYSDLKKIIPSLKIWLFKKICDPQNAGSSSKFVYKFLYHSHSQLKSQQNASRYLKTKCNQGRIILLRWLKKILLNFCYLHFVGHGRNFMTQVLKLCLIHIIIHFIIIAELSERFTCKNSLIIFQINIKMWPWSNQHFVGHSVVH